MIRLALVLALVGCAPKAPPKVFVTELPPLEEPELGAPAEPTQDAAPVAAAMKPGQPAPYVEEAGGRCLATHRAQVVPEDQVADLLQDQARATFWEDRARIDRDGRVLDRAYCETVAVPLHEENTALRKENRVLRWAAPVALTVGILVGALAATAGETLGSAP